MFSGKLEIILLVFVGLIFGGLSWTDGLSVAAQNGKGASATANSAADAPKYALLIGVNKYKKYAQNKVRDLNGTNNDVELMKNLLVDIYKFQYDKDAKDSPMKILLNENATQAAIREAFQTQLIDKAKKYQQESKVSPKDGATVVFYYSGHGSKLPDDNGDESDGIDETIMPSDTTVDRDNQKDIRDDEFDVWFTELKKYTTNITFIFDSCHSGTVTRGGNNKSVEREFPVPNSSRGAGGEVEDGMTRGESYVAIAGSLPTQESQEDKFIDPDTKVEQWDGALTFAIVHLLRTNPDITYRELMNEVQKKVVAMRKGQTPQAEGDIDRRVFGTSETRGKTPIYIEKSSLVKKTIDSTEQEIFEIEMKVGSIVGAGNGAAIAVFAKKPGEKVSEQIGSGQVVSSTEFDSKAEIVLNDKTIKEMPKDAIVNVVSPSFSNRDTQLIAFDYPAATGGKGGETAIAEATVKVMDYVRDKLKEKSLVQTVKESSLYQKFFGSKGATSPEWSYAVVSGTFREFKLGNDAAETKKISKSGQVEPCAQAKPASEDERGFYIINRDGQPVYNLWFNEKDESAGSCLTESIGKIAKIENLRYLTSGESDLNNTFKVDVVRLKSFALTSRSPLKCSSEPVAPEEQTKDQTGTLQMRAGDKYYLKINNDSENDLYVYIYTLGTNGKIEMLFPPVGAEEGEILLKGRSFTTLEKLAPGNCGAFEIEPPEDDPPGVETLKIIATTQKFPGKMLEQNAIAKGAERGNPLFSILEKAATGTTRSGVMRFEISDWVTKDINIEIVK